MEEGGRCLWWMWFPRRPVNLYLPLHSAVLGTLRWTTPTRHLHKISMTQIGRLLDSCWNKCSDISYNLESLPKRRLRELGIVTWSLKDQLVRSQRETKGLQRIIYCFTTKRGFSSFFICLQVLNPVINTMSSTCPFCICNA